MTPLARRARDRRRKAAQHIFTRTKFMTRGARGDTEDGMTDEEYMEAVRNRVRQIHWWAPPPAKGVKK